MSLLGKSGDTLKRIVENGREAVRRAGERALETTAAIQATRTGSLEQTGPEPPVVARLVVEIRSDGSQTIARGALEDTVTGQRVAVRADGTSPANLARSLASTLVTLPLFASRIAKAIQRGEIPEEIVHPKPDEK